MPSPGTKSASSHPKYIDMIVNAVKALSDKNGSSRQAINKYIVKEYNLTENNHHNAMLKQALIRGSGTNGPLLHNKGKGAAGSFKIKVIQAKPDKKPAKTASAKKKAVKKAAPSKKNATKAKPKKPAVKQPEAKPVVSEPTAGKPAKKGKTAVSKEKIPKKSKASTPKKPKVVKAAKKSPKKPAKKSGASRK